MITILSRESVGSSSALARAAFGFLKTLRYIYVEQERSEYYEEQAYSHANVIFDTWGGIPENGDYS